MFYKLIINLQSGALHKGQGFVLESQVKALFTGSAINDGDGLELILGNGVLGAKAKLLLRDNQLQIFPELEKAIEFDLACSFHPVCLVQAGLD